MHWLCSLPPNYHLHSHQSHCLLIIQPPIELEIKLKAQEQVSKKSRAENRRKKGTDRAKEWKQKSCHGIMGSAVTLVPAPSTLVPPSPSPFNRHQILSNKKPHLTHNIENNTPFVTLPPSYREKNSNKITGSPDSLDGLFTDTTSLNWQLCQKGGVKQATKVFCRKTRKSVFSFCDFALLSLWKKLRTIWGCFDICRSKSINGRPWFQMAPHNPLLCLFILECLLARPRAASLCRSKKGID